MFSRPIKEINAEFLAEERYLDSIQRIAREACAAAGMPRKQVTAVLLAIEEGATNIIRHAYLYEKGTLRLRIVIYKKMIAFSLFDSGRSFQPDNSVKLDLEKLVESGRRGGLGFYMVQKIMDSVEYISAAGFNELRMIKRIRGDVDRTPLLRRMFNLRVKFSLSTMLIICLIAGAVYTYVSMRAEEEAYAHLDATVSALATTITDQVAGYIINRRSDVEFDRLTISYMKSNPFLRLIVVTDSTNSILAHSDDIRNIRKVYQPPNWAPPGRAGEPRRAESGSERLSYIMLPALAGERSLGAVYVVYSSETLSSKLDKAKRETVLLTIGLMFIGILGIYLLSSRFVTPIVKITQRVRRFTSGDLETELPLDGKDEFFEISRALNEMITRLSRDKKNVIERERLAKEIEVASQIQKTLLPHELPSLPGLEIDAYYRAASMVGGDLYDVFPIGDQRYCLVMADVSGKGVPASLVMSMLRTVIQIQAQSKTSAKDTLLAVDDYLSGNIPGGMFITVLLAILDAPACRLNLVSAGHNPLLHYQSGIRKIVQINPPGMPMGVPHTAERSFADSLKEVDINLRDGDIFFLYTDGVTEATNRDGKQYGLDRLIEYIQDQLRNQHHPEVAELGRGIVEQIDEFAGFAKQTDDMTFILARASMEKEPPDSATQETGEPLDIRNLPDDSDTDQG